MCAHIYTTMCTHITAPSHQPGGWEAPGRGLQSPHPCSGMWEKDPALVPLMGGAAGSPGSMREEGPQQETLAFLPWSSPVGWACLTPAAGAVALEKAWALVTPMCHPQTVRSWPV